MKAPVSVFDVAQVLRARKLFRPKLAELPVQCASCPFREGNDSEFAAVCEKLAVTGGFEAQGVSQVRASVKREVAEHGDFACHGSAYLDGERRDDSEHRQCPGATQWFKSNVPERMLP